MSVYRIANIGALTTTALGKVPYEVFQRVYPYFPADAASAALDGNCYLVEWDDLVAAAGDVSAQAHRRAEGVVIPFSAMLATEHLGILEGSGWYWCGSAYESLLTEGQREGWARVLLPDEVIAHVKAAASGDRPLDFFSLPRVMQHILRQQNS